MPKIDYYHLLPYLWDAHLAFNQKATKIGIFLQVYVWNYEWMFFYY